jgi:TPR repeat protein
VREAAQYYAIAAGNGNGNDSAMAALGLCYENGVGVPVEIERAAEWYRRASAAEAAAGGISREKRRAREKNMRKPGGVSPKRP